MSFIYRWMRRARPRSKAIKGSPHCDHRGRRKLAMFTAFMGKLGMKLDDVQLISVATTTNLATALNTFAGQADQGNGV
jgi:hypothetical protein